MYILYYGTVTLFFDADCTKKITSLSANRVFGDAAL
jgi:hypothetical protein